MHFVRYYFIALTSMIYVFLLGFIKKRHRDLIYAIGKHFGFSSKVKSNLKHISISELLKNDPEVVISCADGVDGNISLYELTVISRIAKTYAKTNVFEIGTFDGRTTLNIALNTPPGCRICTLDLPASMKNEVKYELAAYESVYVDKLSSGSKFVNHPAVAKITQVYGDSAVFDFSPYYGTCDLVFVDGSHAYKYVKDDTLQAFKLLKKEGGIILWHDCGVWNGVTQYLHELDKQMPGKLVQINDTSVVFTQVGGQSD